MFQISWDTGDKIRVNGAFDGAAVNTTVSILGYAVYPSYLQLRERLNDVDNLQNIKVAKRHMHFSRETTIWIVPFSPTNTIIVSSVI